MLKSCEGSFEKLEAFNKRGSPSGSFAAQFAAGPDTAVPNATTNASTAATSKSAPTAFGTCILSRKRKRGLSSRENTKARASGQTISAVMYKAASRRMTNIPPRKMTLGSDGQGHGLFTALAYMPGALPCLAIVVRSRAVPFTAPKSRHSKTPSARTEPPKPEPPLQDSKFRMLGFSSWPVSEGHDTTVQFSLLARSVALTLLEVFLHRSRSPPCSFDNSASQDPSDLGWKVVNRRDKARRTRHLAVAPPLRIKCVLWL